MQDSFRHRGRQRSGWFRTCTGSTRGRGHGEGLPYHYLALCVCQMMESVGGGGGLEGVWERSWISDWSVKTRFCPQRYRSLYDWSLEGVYKNNPAHFRQWEGPRRPVLFILFQKRMVIESPDVVRLRQYGIGVQQQYAMSHKAKAELEK